MSAAAGETDPASAGGADSMAMGEGDSASKGKTASVAVDGMDPVAPSEADPTPMGEAIARESWDSSALLGADSARTYRLGIMGGTFDPIHNGHLVAAQQASDDLDLDLVLFMPAGQPAFKQDRRVSSAEDRFAMTLLATADNPSFVASRLEIERPGVTYTVDTLKALRERYPANVELYFITGADAIIDIVSWHDAETIAQIATLVGATRPGYDLAWAKAAIEGSKIQFDVRYLEVPALAISSSYLRERSASGQSIRYLTKDSVIGYIEKHGLYGEHWATTSGAPLPIERDLAEKRSDERPDGHFEGHSAERPGHAEERFERPSEGRSREGRSA